MSKATEKLRKVESAAYKEWTAAARYVGLCRNALILADTRDRDEKQSLYTMAVARCDAAFNRWQDVCQALDEVEMSYHRPSIAPATQPAKAAG